MQLIFDNGQVCHGLGGVEHKEDEVARARTSNHLKWGLGSGLSLVLGVEHKEDEVARARTSNLPAGLGPCHPQLPQ